MDLEIKRNINKASSKGISRADKKGEFMG